MPREQDHVALANRNHDTLTHLLKDPSLYSEWIATVAFYKAVQIVEAFLAKCGKPCHDHKSRHNCLKNHYPNIWKHYRPLWQASCIARYLHDNYTGTPYTKFCDYITPENIEHLIVKKRLRPVEQMAVGHLSDSSKSALQRIP